VPAGQVPASVVKVIGAADCCASGVVMSKPDPMYCSAETSRSADVAAVPAVVISPVIEAGAPAGVRGTLFSASPGCTPVITVAAYTWLAIRPPSRKPVSGPRGRRAEGAPGDGKPLSSR